MGDVAELQITPETPGRQAILNPFESPNDYHHLHESLVNSPSEFKCSKAFSATPAKFKWSIDEMSSLLPVHIDPEDIRRQALYFNQTRMDSEVEAKRQIAIEQFFTKGPIVPSPWGPPGHKQSVQSSLSPLVMEEPQSPKKINAMCQTVLTLPVDFNLEEVLGNHYRLEDVSEQVQESLSSSSLRRKLFRDGRSSGSESSAPSSPDRESPAGKATMSSSSVVVSPLRCGIATTTPSSGQFSSSPIQDRCRAYSLGSSTSPMFPERSSPVFKSPTVSPINLQHPLTPLSGERKCLFFVSPDCLPSGSRSKAVNHCGESPYVEGCSPIRSCSPLHCRAPNIACTWASPIHISPILHLEVQDKENFHTGEPLPSMDLDACSPAPCPHRQGLHPGRSECRASPSSLERMEQSEAEEGGMTSRLGKGRREAVEGEGVEEMVGGEEFLPEEDTASPAHLAGSRAGGASHVESTRMFVSLLAEGSVTPYDVSMQVDSGYNTYSTCTTSLMDAISSESQSKEQQDSHTAAEEGLAYAKHTKPKTGRPVQTNRQATSKLVTPFSV